MAKRLRSGYTTGACAAAAAKAATMLALQGTAAEKVELIFTDGSRHSFVVAESEKFDQGARATIIKDAGDDPDVTNGARISATVRPIGKGTFFAGLVKQDNILLTGGEGVGTVTKPGLAVTVGEPAINPIPRHMIFQAVREIEESQLLQVEISVPDGKRLAEKTLNRRLGIEGGLSILGTTGIVRPVSAEAWTATIEASMSVARTAGLSDIVLSTGRTSEKGVQNLLHLPEEAYAMMGDYLEFSLKKASEYGFTTIHLAGMWAKIMKAAMHIGQTHVRNGALEIKDAAALLQTCGVEEPLFTTLAGCNTAREMYGCLEAERRAEIITAICERARDYGKEVSSRRVRVYLVDARAQVVCHV